MFFNTYKSGDFNRLTCLNSIIMLYKCVNQYCYGGIMNKRLLNSDWMFAKNHYSENLLDEIPQSWINVDLPHDWLIYDTDNLYEDSIGWYKRNIYYSFDKQKWILRFEGVYMNSSIYVNGKKIFDWKYGYSTFDVDITPYLLEGNNELLVRVIHQSPNSRWYSGAGIYRNVWLLKMPDLHILPDGIYITPIKQKNFWNIEIDTELRIGEENPEYISHILIDPNGKEIETKTFSLAQFKNLKNSVIKVNHTMKIENPKLWDIGCGNVYRLKTQLLRRGSITDEDQNSFGFRTISFDSEEGFFLNGKSVKIKGVCEHHGFGCLGAIVNKSAIRRKLELLRKMGVNAIRTAHNMPSVEFMELADEMGFLVDSEAFDMWGNGKTTYDYGRFFSEWFKKDVASWIRRDRNHPSIIMWSVGNEIYDMHAGEEGYIQLKELVSQVKKHDPLGHAKTTFASNYMRWENAQRCSELVDLVGYNYGEALYDEHHKLHPEWVIYGSETSSMLASRGIYHFPLDKDILCEDDEQCSALGNSFAGWGAHDYLDNIIADRDRKFSLGQFIWSGFDYFGEPIPYHTRNSYFGQIDTAGFPKDSFYIYQAEWTDFHNNPMIHIFPYWDFNEGQDIDVCVCSNAPHVELLLNGRSYGRRDFDHTFGKDLIGHWRIPYEKGELVAYAYDDSNNIIATDIKKSFGDAYGIQIKSNQLLINSDTDELLFLEVSLYDHDMNPVENGNNRIFVEIEGPGTIVGMDNGDSTDFESVKSNNKRMFQGKLLVVVKPIPNSTGQIKVTMSSKELVSASYSCLVSKHEREEDEIQQCTDVIIHETTNSEFADEVPIRKIELICEEGTNLSNENDTATVSYKIYPENATFHNLEWKIVNDIGIELSIADLQVNKGEVIVKAKGDGRFNLRCNAMNGRRVANVRSTLGFEVRGMGSLYLNPFEKNCTGICLNRSDGLSEGEGHGVRFLGRKNTRIFFDPMDFGKYGTEFFVTELFKYMEEPVSFRIYEIMEEEQKEILLLDAIFEDKANWLEFKEKKYLLKKRLQGIKKICIESTDNFQMKTFCFLPILHGLEKIYAGESDEIFGDRYYIKDNVVEGIGNNTTLAFDNVNFGDITIRSLTICGRGRQKNTIHVKIDTDESSVLELIEFPESEEYIEKEFLITKIQGNAKVSFVFLPGSDFDFAWFRFK